MSAFNSLEEMAISMSTHAEDSGEMPNYTISAEVPKRLDSGSSAVSLPRSTQTESQET